MLLFSDIDADDIRAFMGMPMDDFELLVERATDGVQRESPALIQPTTDVSAARHSISVVDLGAESAGRHSDVEVASFVDEMADILGMPRQAPAGKQKSKKKSSKPSSKSKKKKSKSKTKSKKKSGRASAGQFSCYSSDDDDDSSRKPRRRHKKKPDCKKKKAKRSKRSPSPSPSSSWSEYLPTPSYESPPSSTGTLSSTSSASEIPGRRKGAEWKRAKLTGSKSAVSAKKDKKKKFKSKTRSSKKSKTGSSSTHKAKSKVKSKSKTTAMATSGSGSDVAGVAADPVEYERRVEQIRTDAAQLRATLQTCLLANAIAKVKSNSWFSGCKKHTDEKGVVVEARKGVIPAVYNNMEKLITAEMFKGAKKLTQKDGRTGSWKNDHREKSVLIWCIDTAFVCQTVVHSHNICVCVFCVHIYIYIY